MGRVLRRVQGTVRRVRGAGGIARGVQAGVGEMRRGGEVMG